jgi:hypothetical protein
MFTSIISPSSAHPTLRSSSITALIAVTLLASQSIAAQAQPQVTLSPLSPTQMAPPEVAPTPASIAKVETVEDRITGLHNSLQITAAEEADWTAVALVMRGNASAMEKLVAEKSAKDPANLTAIDDLKTYEIFAQAHVTGLKNLITAFEKLYTAMPAAQKKIADEVFRNAGHAHAASHG